MRYLFGYSPFNIKQEKAGGEGGSGGGAGGEGNKGGDGGKEGGADLNALLTEIKSMRTELASLKSAPKNEPEEDPTLKKIQDDKARKAKESATQDKVVRAAKFNLRFDTFLKEYAGVIPDDAQKIPTTASESDYPNELDRAAAMKASLMASFFKEEKNLRYLSESQLARWKTYQALGQVGRQEEADAVYDAVFEPAVNHARSIRQSEIKNKEVSYTGSSDSDIIFKKVHEKLLRSIGTNHKLNDVLHAQAKGLGLATDNS